jgi:membrane protease YdiL (CAAX protease family)
VNSNARGVVAYLVGAFTIAWANLAAADCLGFSSDPLRYRVVTLPAVFAPAMAAFVVRKWVTREGFSDAGLRPNLRKRWPYYLFAWFYPALVAVGVLALMMCMGARPSEPIPAFWLLFRVAPLPLELTVGSLAAGTLIWGEEFGWRGYLQVRLLAHRPVLAAIATGLIWTVWHAPGFLWGAVLSIDLALSAVAFALGAVLVSIVLGWLRLRTGSIWPATLFHAAHNTAIAAGTLTTLISAMAGRGWDWTWIAWILYFIPVAALCVWILVTGQLRWQGTAEGTAEQSPTAR